MPNFYPNQRAAAPTFTGAAPRFAPPAGPADIGVRPKPRPVPSIIDQPGGNRTSPGPFDGRYQWYSRYMQGYRGSPGFAQFYRRMKYLRYLKWIRIAFRHPAWQAAEIAGEIAWDFIYQQPATPGIELDHPPGWTLYYSCAGVGNYDRRPNHMFTAAAASTFQPYYCPVQQGVNTTWNDTHNFMFTANRYLYYAATNSYRMHYTAVYHRDPSNYVPGRPDMYPEGETGPVWGREPGKDGAIAPSIRTEVPIYDPLAQLRPAISWAPIANPIPIWQLPGARPDYRPIRDQRPEDSNGGNSDGSGNKPDQPGDGGSGGGSIDPPIRPPQPRPPGRGTKERKVNTRATKVVADALGKLTEIMDAVEVAWDAIDRECVRKKGGKLTGNKTQDVYRYASCINVEDFLLGLIGNQVEDAIIGRLFALDAASRKKLYNHFGYYPTGRRLVEIALEGGLPLDVQKIVENLLKSAIDQVTGRNS